MNSTSATTLADRFLSGGGNMGESIRSFPWHQHPLGPPSSWPQSLLTTISIIINSKFPMFLWWGEDLFQFYNDAYRPSLGSNGKHPGALGQRAEDCWQEIWTIIKPLIDQVRTTGVATWSEDQLIPIYRNGQIEDVYWTFGYSPVKNEDGDIGGVLVVCNETTEKMLSLKKIEESNRRFHTNVMQAPVAMCTFSGPDYIVEIANERVLELWQRKAEDVLGKPLFEALPEVKGQGLEELLGNVYATGIPYSENNRPVDILRHGEMQTRYLSFVYEALKEHDGTITGIAVAAVDVTDHVHAQRLVSENEEKLKVVIEASELGTWELNLQTREVSYSKRYLEILGYPDAVELTHEQIIKHLHPDDLHVREKAFADAFETGVLHYASRLIWNDGSLHWMEGKGRVFFDDQKKPLRMTGTLRDITHEKLFTEELERRVSERTAELKHVNSELVKTNNELEQFAYISTHDLQEPLRKIQTFSQMMADIVQDGSQAKTYLEKINTSAARMSGLIRDLLNYSRLSKTNEQYIETDLGAIVQNILIDFELLISRLNAKVNCPPLPVIRAIPFQINQLFYNLISNSLKFCDRTPQINISWDYAKPEELLKWPALNSGRPYVHLQFADNGIGFLKEYAEQVFVIFQRLHSDRQKYGGTGIGLAICKKIVENHGGVIYADSEFMQGTVIHVLLPA